MAKKKEIISNGTLFNVQDVHVSRIAKILESQDIVIIHGDGSMFSGKDAMLGSEHHREFNSGVAEINRNEVISRSKFRAIYKKGDVLPTTPQDIIKEFYNDQARTMQDVTKEVNQGNFDNAISVAD